MRPPRVYHTGAVDTIITLNTALPDPVDGIPPSWIQLTPIGTFKGRDGRGPYSVDAHAVAAASPVPFPLDENHAIDLAQTTGAASPARGWVVELQARESGVWGRVDWTEAGGAMVAKKEYRGVSPALSSDKATGRVIRVLRAGLTNLPNFDMVTLHHQETAGMTLDQLRPALAAALGLASDATLEDCIASAARATQAATLHAADLTRLAAAAGAATPTVSAIETVLAAARPAAAQADRMAAEIVSLNTQLGELRTNAARDKATTAIDAAIKAGKPITALRDHYIARHMADPAAVDLELGAMLSLHAGGVGYRPPPGADGVIVATAEETQVAANMGLTVAQLAGARAQREANRGKH